MPFASITTRPQPSVSQDTHIVRRIDHLIVRTAESSYRQLRKLFTDVLQLPAHKRTAERSAYTGTSIYVGNLDLRLLPTAAESMESVAQFYGIAMQTQVQDLSRLRARGIDYIPEPYYLADEGGDTTLLRMNVFLNGYLGESFSMRALFAMNRVVPDSVWMMTLAREAPDRIHGAKFIANRVYRDGLVYLVKYNPGWREVDAERRRSIADFIARGGGSLGIVSVREVNIGVRDTAKAYSKWQSLLYPAEETETGYWRLDEGPAIRLIEAHQDAIHHLVLEVESLSQAEQVLDDIGLLGRSAQDEVCMQSEKLGGLDIRLVQATA